MLLELELKTLNIELEGKEKRMILLVTNEHAVKYNLSALKGDRIIIILEILNKRDQDHIVIIDDIKRQAEMFEYLGLDYKVVVGVPEVPVTNALLYDTHPDKVIDFNSFQKRVNPKTIEQDEHDKLFNKIVSKEDDLDDAEA